MKQKKSNALSVLLDYAGSHKRLTFLGLTLAAFRERYLASVEEEYRHAKAKVEI